jgi:beta-1,4-mannosyl-glycoprotein beta-1,4-N-acetylglucosaminyltransferase
LNAGRERGETAVMIYDCFTFFNELDLLEIRLHELNEIVDRFVLVEANRTFQGEPKPYYFKENANKFSQFTDKIIYVAIEIHDCDLRSHIRTYAVNATWAREYYQRDQISRGLSNASPDDLIIVSDVDEIISGNKLREAIITRAKHDLTVFKMPIYTGSINRRLKNDVWEKGPRMIEYSDFPGAEHLRLTKIAASNRLGNSALGRLYTRYQNYVLRNVPNRICIIENSGWHMTSIGDWRSYRNKVSAYSQAERAHREDFKSEEAFERRLSDTTAIVNLSELPQFVRENPERFQLVS